MEAGVSRRIGLAALVAASALGFGTGLVLYADAARSGAPGAQLLPDLKVERPSELYLESHKQIRLRVSNTISNTGTGPLQIDGDGNACSEGDTTGRRTVQRIFEDDPTETDSLGHFIRGEDEGHQDVQAGCSRYHPAHDHWHFDNFARYTLYSEKTGNPVGSSRKVSFCVIDTGQPYPGLPGSPEESYYPQDSENPEFPTCSETSTDGLSIGWDDTYGASLPGQGINVTGLRRGSYCLMLEVDPPTANPDGVLAESDSSNNVRTVRVRLRPRRGVVHRLGADCSL